jgi:signal peptidase I
VTADSPGRERGRLRAELRWLVETIAALAILTAVVLVGTKLVAIPWTVLGPSMKPALQPGDRVIVDLWTYRHRAPEPGEVALLLGPDGTPLVKRIAREPGPPEAAAPFVLDPEDRSSRRLWVVGDNPGESSDSRLFGPVPAGRFRGRVVFRYWPLSRFGLVR